MKNRSFLVQLEHLKIQEGKFNGLAVCTISIDLDFWIFSYAAPSQSPSPRQPIKIGFRAVHKFQLTFSKSVQRTTANETRSFLSPVLTSPSGHGTAPLQLLSIHKKINLVRLATFGCQPLKCSQTLVLVSPSPD